MFCLPNIQPRHKLLGGPLSHRQFNNNLFVKLVDAQKPKIVTKVLRLANKTVGSRTHRSYSSKETGNLTNRTIKDEVTKEDKQLPYVTVFLLDTIEQYEDIRKRIVVLDLEKYFETYFRKSLQGPFTTNFYLTIDKYLQKLTEQQKYLKTPINVPLPIDLLQINTKEGLLKAIEVLEEKGDQQTLTNLIRYFCQPSQQFREEVIKDIKLILKNELRENYDYLDNQLTGQYVLTDMQKKLIRDLMQIRFNTVSLMFCKAETLNEQYQKFYNLNKDRVIGRKKSDFIESLKLSFRFNHPQIEQRKTARLSLANHGNQTERTTVRHRRRVSTTRLQESKDIEKQLLYQHFKDIPADYFNQLYDQFVKLHSNNDNFIKQFNIHQQNRGILLMQTFLETCPYMGLRKPQTKKKILKCMEFPQGKQFVSRKQYIQFRILVDCKAPRDIIVNFLVKYLNLGKKPLTKTQLYNILLLTISQDNTERSCRIITDILWLWLKKNNYVDYTEDTEIIQVMSFRERFFRN